MGGGLLKPKSIVFFLLSVVADLQKPVTDMYIKFLAKATTPRDKQQSKKKKKKKYDTYYTYIGAAVP